MRPTKKVKFKWMLLKTSKPSKKKINSCDIVGPVVNAMMGGIARYANSQHIVCIVKLDAKLSHALDVKRSVVLGVGMVILATDVTRCFVKNVLVEKTKSVRIVVKLFAQSATKETLIHR